MPLSFYRCNTQKWVFFSLIPYAYHPFSLVSGLSRSAPAAFSGCKALVAVADDRGWLLFHHDKKGLFSREKGFALVMKKVYARERK
ncbi:hypothetical protein, partial [Alloprevotella tannerae]|uniref:hypothetical protein n=1 Tax=Alloprevotella tannerae TaxID=76122 RepID=UPI0028E58324